VRVRMPEWVEERSMVEVEVTKKSRSGA